MPFCRNCGTQLEDDAKFCPECGNATENGAPYSDPQANAESATAANFFPQASSGSLNVGMLVWSILNLVFCCLPLSVVSIIMTVTASKAATAEEEIRHLKTAKICNLIANIGAVVIYALYFLVLLITALLLDTAA